MILKNNRLMQMCLQAGWSPAKISQTLKIPAQIVEEWQRGEKQMPIWVEQKISLLMQIERQQENLRRTMAKNNLLRKQVRRPKPKRDF